MNNQNYTDPNIPHNKIVDYILKNLVEIHCQDQQNFNINNIDKIITIFINFIDLYGKFSSSLSSKDLDNTKHRLFLVTSQIRILKDDIETLSKEYFSNNFILEIIMDLRSVVIQTEKSVTQIIDIADELLKISKDITDHKIKNDIIEKSIRILELCNFQDITGQKIQKICYQLNKIEPIYSRLIGIFSENINEKKNIEYESPISFQKDQDKTDQKQIDDLFK